MSSLEKELKHAELASGREVNLIDSYKVLIKRLHEIGPLIIAIDGNPTRTKCQELQNELVDIRLRGVPAFETLVKKIKEDRIVENSLKRVARTEKQSINFEKNIKSKTQNHE